LKIKISIAVLFLFCSCKNQDKQAEGLFSPAEKEVEQISSSPENFSPGKKVYTNFCVQCHLPNGEGIPNIYPPLANSDWLTEKRKESIHAVKYGLRGEIQVNGKTYNNIMLPLGLSDQEIADVMNYVMNSWGNTQQKPVTVEEVSAIDE